MSRHNVPYTERIGQKFNMLTIVEITGTEPCGTQRKTLCLAKCDCGKLFTSRIEPILCGSRKHCGCIRKKPSIGVPYEHRIGQKFNMLTIVEITGRRNTGRRTKVLALVRCDCGVEKETLLESVVNKQIFSCGCARKKTKNSALRKSYTNYMNGAKHRSYYFNLTEDEFESICTQPCHYCGLPPSRIVEMFGDTFVMTGIDRLNNYLGYSVDNCVSCCPICNRAKNDMPYEDFMNWIKAVKSIGSNDEGTTLRPQPKTQQNMVHRKLSENPKQTG